MQFYVYYSSSFCTDHNHRHNIAVRCHCPSLAGITDGEDEQDDGGRLCPTIGRGVRRGGGDGPSRTPPPGPEVDGKMTAIRSGRCPGADAVIGDGALAGIAGAPAPLAVIVPAPAEGCMGL